VASAVALTEYRVDPASGTAFQPYVTAFTLLEGTHTIEYRSQDHAGNIESIRITTVAVDVSGPVLTLSVSTPSYTDDSSRVYVGSQTVLAVLAADSAGIVQSGVASASYAVGGGTIVPIASSFTLAGLMDGSHSIEARGLDHVGNSADRIFPVFLDQTPPVSQVKAGTVTYAGGSTIVVSSDTAMEIVSTDTLSGLAAGSYAVDGDPARDFGVSPVPLDLSVGTHTVTVSAVDFLGNREADEVFSILVTSRAPVDTVAPVTQIIYSSVTYIDPAGNLYINGETTIGFVAIDTGPAASGVASTEYRVDPASGTPFQPYVTAFLLAEGVHKIEYRSQDHAGNLEPVQVSGIRVDAHPPVTTIVFDPPPSSTTPVIVVSTWTFISLSAADEMAGVARTEMRIDPADESAPFEVFSGSFTLPLGPHVLDARSIDRVDNLEEARRYSVQVASRSVMPPPTAELLSPSARGAGIDLVFGRDLIPVIGTVDGPSLDHWVLETAPGAGVLGGFGSLASGTAPVTAAQLALWDTRSLGGYQTLRLSAWNTEGVGAVSTATVTIGEPSLDLLLQNPPVKGKKQKLLNQPQGIAADRDGRIYVANSGANSVLKFDGMGTLLAKWKGLGGMSAFAFSLPTGVAVDELLNVYVADRNNHRIVLLDASGVPALVLGRTDNRNRPQSGSGPGQFSSPWGVAVSSTRFAVADTNNARLQVFSRQGGFLFMIALPRAVHDQAPRPFGVAFDAEGNIYTLDLNNDRLIAYDPSGRLLYATGTAGSLIGQFDRPQGVAASFPGYLYIADKYNARIQKLDAWRHSVLTFGRSFNLNRPAGTAVDTQTNLYVTDSANNLVMRLGSGASPAHQVFVPLVDPASDEPPSSSVFPEQDVFAGSGAADLSFVLGEVFAFPNPAKAGERPTIHVEAGLADRVTIQIYNLAGQEMATAALDQTPVVIDSGSGPRYAYEWTWSGSAASGVYLYAVDAEKSGEHLKKTGKFAVVR
jgi:sugar lactone lactonase YvrE